MRSLERAIEEPGLPASMLKRLQGGTNDEVIAMDSERGVLLAPAEPEVEEFLEDVQAIRRRYWGALKRLAR